jgi:glycosyltransferase involved in cell wall biosynthesis
MNLNCASYNHEPLVSVIMNGYNCEKFLKQAIDSVVSQTYKNWEIIFWDNASTDSTQSIATSYGPRLRYFRSETNTTLGVARNRAIEQAQGEFIAFLDTDDYWLPEKLVLQVAIFQKSMDVDFIYSNCYFLNQQTGRQRKWLRKPQPVGNVFGRFLQHYPVNLQTVLFRRSALDALDHYFDDHFEVSEEFDLFMRILYRSKAYYIDAPTVVYRIHADMSSIKQIERYPMECLLILDKLQAIDEEIANTYSREIKTFKAKIAFWQARADMFYGRPSDARCALKPYIFQSVVFAVLFLSTYSCGLWSFLLKANRLLKNLNF